MSVASSIRGGETQYYTFQTERQRQKINVIDADHGIFESKSKKHALSPRKLMQKLKSNSSNKNNNDSVILRKNEDFDLRAEPELADVYWRHSTRSEMEYDSDSSVSEDDSVIMYEVSESKTRTNTPSFWKSSKKDKTGMVQSLKQSAPTARSLKDQATTDRKSHLELEYEKMKIKAIRYQAERDALHIKLKKREMAQKMRDYEYYCVNGINRNIAAESIGMIEGNTYQPRISEFQEFQRTNESPRYVRVSDRSQKNKIRKREDFRKIDIFDKLSGMLPPAVIQMFEVYGNYIPSTKTVEEFHRAVLIWISSMPLINFVYPLLLALTIFIPKNSKRSWSILSIMVAFLDLVILFVYGCGIYKATCIVYRLISTFYRLGNLFGLV